MGKNNVRIGKVGTVGAIGASATGTVTVHTQPDPNLNEIAHRLRELRDLLRQSAPDLLDGPAAQQALADTERELNRKARPGTLKQLLSRITVASAGVTAVTAAVSAVTDLVAKLK